MPNCAKTSARFGDCAEAVGFEPTGALAWMALAPSDFESDAIDRSATPPVIGPSVGAEGPSLSLLRI